MAVRYEVKKASMTRTGARTRAKKDHSRVLGASEPHGVWCAGKHPLAGSMVMEKQLGVCLAKKERGKKRAGSTTSHSTPPSIPPRSRPQDDRNKTASRHR